jgi:hypothetical protein
LAKEGASKVTPDDLDLQTPDEFNVQGAKLSAKLVYKGIRNVKMERRPPSPDKA